MSDKPASRIIPNTFQTPNALTDDAIMSVLSGNEVKCYLVIVRKTFGWNKQSDRIAKSQIMELTGLGENAVDACMNSLVEFGLVLRLAENDPRNNYGILWALQTDDEKISWEALSQRTKIMAEKHAEKMLKLRMKRLEVGLTVTPTLDGQGDGVDGQGGGGVDHQGTQQPLSTALNSLSDAQALNFKDMTINEARKLPTIAMYTRATEFFPGSLVWQVVHEFILAHNLSEEKIKAAAIAWSLRGYNRENVEGILEWARDGVPTKGAKNGNFGANSRTGKTSTSGRKNGRTNIGADSAGAEGQNAEPPADADAAKRHREQWEELRKKANVPAVQ